MFNRLGLIWVLSIAVTSLGIGRSAHAQVAEAEAMFDEGNKLMAAGDLAKACAAFAASNNIDPRAGTLIRLGECREANHQLASAWTAYNDALARVKDPRKREIATARVAALAPRLSHLTIVVGAHKVAGLVVTQNSRPIDPVIWDQRLPLDGGSYTIGASAPGFAAWQTTITVPPEGGDVRAEVPALAPLPKPAPSPVISPTALAPTVVVPTVVATSETPAPSMWTPRRKVALASGGVAVASLATGVALGVVAKGKRDDAFRLCADPAMPCMNAARANQLTASGHQLAIGADVSFAVAGLGAIAAGILWISGKPPSSERLAIIPTSNGFAVSGRF